MTVLGEIFEHKIIEVAARKRVMNLDELIERAALYYPLNFVSALSPQDHQSGYLSLIAEVKRASPSRGEFGLHIEPSALAGVYRENGASAVSVLTDEKYFKGSLDFLVKIRAAEPELPLLRKDFICDPYQVYESKAAGADAILLIVAGLEHSLLKELFSLAAELGMTALIEVHNEYELEIALELNPILVGVNNRNLHNFSVNLGTSLKMRSLIPDSICMVAESGIHTRPDVEILARAGVNAALVGEALVTARDVGKKVRELSGVPVLQETDETTFHPPASSNPTRMNSILKTR